MTIYIYLCYLVLIIYVNLQFVQKSVYKYYREHENRESGIVFSRVEINFHATYMPFPSVNIIIRFQLFLLLICLYVGSRYL